MKRNIALLAIAASLATVANAVTLSQYAFDNGTIKPAGPRTGASGYNFFNIEGSNNAANASYGIIDFNGTQTVSTGTDPAPGVYGGMFSFGGAVSATSLSIRLTQNNAAFTLAGGLTFAIATANTGVGLHTGTTPAFTDNATQFSPITLGTGTFTPGTGAAPVGTGAPTAVGSGTQDTYTFALSGAAQTAVNSALNGGSAIRLIITPTDATVAATYSGATVYSATDISGWTPAQMSDKNYWRPQLTINANPVPEPASLSILGLGALGLIRRRRNKV